MLTRHPFANDMEVLTLIFIRSSSLASMDLNLWRTLTMAYEICVKANCCPRQTRGPPLKGPYSHLDSNTVTVSEIDRSLLYTKLLCVRVCMCVMSL